MSTPPANWHPKRGEVYIAKLDKDRPAIILSIDRINRFALDVCVVGVTKVDQKAFSMRIPLKAGEGGLHIDCWAKCDQVTTLEKKYLQYPAIGVLPKDKFLAIEEQVKISLGFAEGPLSLASAVR